MPQTLPASPGEGAAANPPPPTGEKGKVRIWGGVQDNMTGPHSTVTNSCDCRPVPPPHTPNLCCVHGREMGKLQAPYVGWLRSRKDPAASQTILKGDTHSSVLESLPAMPRALGSIPAQHKLSVW